MKTQFALISTLVLFSMIACEEEAVGPTTSPGIQYSFPTSATVIRSIYPHAGQAGTEVVIFGENFGPTVSDNYVTFNSEPAEITYIGYGVLSVRVPENLRSGEYTINLNAGGQAASAPGKFTVTDSPY